MEDGRKPYDLQANNPAILASDVAREFARDPASRRHAIDVTVDADTPGTVLADSEALRHAIWNLLDNAVKYSPGGSRVTLSVRAHAAGVAIEVCDSGIGVPKSEREGIFLKFVRGVQAQRLGIKGTGVGLAIVSHIVRAHGGSVEIESQEGVGSTFRLVLPACS